MAWEVWLTFFGAAIAISVSPGAGAIQSMATGLTHGVRRGYWSILGLEVGLMLQLALVAIGLGAAVANSILAFNIIKWIGVAYLVYLAVRQWRTATVDLREQIGKAVDGGRRALRRARLSGQRHQPQGPGVLPRRAAAVRGADRAAAAAIPGDRRDDDRRRPRRDGPLHGPVRRGCCAGCNTRGSRRCSTGCSPGCSPPRPSCCRWCGGAARYHRGEHRLAGMVGQTSGRLPRDNPVHRGREIATRGE